MDILCSVLSPDKEVFGRAPFSKTQWDRALVLVDFQCWGTFTECFWQLFGRCVTAWWFGDWGDSGAVSADWAYQPRPGARAEMGSPQHSAHSPGDKRWQPGPNRISTPSLSPTLQSVFVCVTEWLGVRGWGGGAPLAMINGPLIWFSIFLGCVCIICYSAGGCLREKWYTLM